MEQPKVMIIERNFADFKEGEIYVLEKDHYECAAFYDKKVHKDLIPQNGSCNFESFIDAERHIKSYFSISYTTNLFYFFSLLFGEYDEIQRRRLYAIKVMEIYKTITHTK